MILARELKIASQAALDYLVTSVSPKGAARDEYNHIVGGLTEALKAIKPAPSPEDIRVCKFSDLTRVRIAQPGDEEELYHLCLCLHRENGIFSVKPDYVRELLQRALAQRDAVMGVIGDPGKIEASICLLVERGDWYTDDWAVHEKWNFVLPKYRGSDNAKMLVEFAKVVAHAAKLPLLIGILSNQRTEAKIKLYERRLGTPAGAFWLHGATTGMRDDHVRQ